MPDPAIATAADYSEALAVARRVKSLLALLLILILLGQIAIFFLVRYDVLRVDAAGAPDLSNVTTMPATQGTSNKLIDIMHYVSGVVILGGIAVSIVLTMVLCLIDHIMLVGRLIGVGKVTSALCWAFVLIVLLFPWQYFMAGSGLTYTDFRVPGVLWTWDEMVGRAHEAANFNGNVAESVLFWFRFAGAPLVALIITLAIHAKSNRGLRMALGEDELLNEMLRTQ